FKAEDGIRDRNVTGVQTCALPILTGGQAGLEVLAAAVMDFETRLAACHLDVVRVRDREKSYNPMDATQRRQLAPAFPWDAYVERSEERRVEGERRSSDGRCEGRRG